ncbi:GDP-mannose 4,6-dehydratase [Paenibacillus filicis]|uniref:GDP-mannose 4,6-dehydratase n=1 Tax=Paenibacillus filicis TaxID=669464 RepID=A0ABU9DQE3_9BACL
MKILITGSGGFVGEYLIQELLMRNHEVYGTVKSSVPKPLFPVYDLNILDDFAVESVIKTTRPDVLIHLAAQSMVLKSWENPKDTLLVNTIGTSNLLSAIIKYSPGTKIISIGSSEEYGITAKNGIELNEEMPCVPQNPYALSKYSAGLLTLQLAKKNHLKAIHVRAFNHFGPGQREGFVVSDFASQIAKIEKNNFRPYLSVGDLSAVRDFTDVRDVAKAYVLLVEKDVENGIYNVCSNKPVAVQEILNELIHLSNVTIDVNVDEAKFRPAEVPFFVGNNTKLMVSTGWKPERSLKESLKETLESWRQRVIGGEYEA